MTPLVIWQIPIKVKKNNSIYHIMYFEKSNNKKNHKIKFSMTLAILVAVSVAIVSVVTQKAYAADPVSSCFILYAIANPAYFQAEQNFVNSLPNDQVLTKLSAQVGNGPI